MNNYTEKNTVQAGLIDLLVAQGWMHVPGSDLPRTSQDVIVRTDLKHAIERLNPHLAGRADAVLAKVRGAIIAAASDGLMAGNQEFTQILRGRRTVLMPDTNHDEPFRLIDFVNPANNAFIVSDEVTYQGARFDLVLWVNGIPVVVGETKTPVSASKTWRDGARDIHDAYEVHQGLFFTPNLLSFATEAKDFRYGSVRTPLEHWQPWGANDIPATVMGWDRVKMSVAGLLAPGVVLNLIEHYAMFERKDDDGIVRTIKLLPRYFQYEAVEKIVARATSQTRARGLIYHTQGSGKTLTMSWVATRLVTDPRMKSPTVIAVADRSQLVRQTFNQFAAAGVPAPTEANSTASLQSSLAREQRGIVATTVHKFAGADVLSTRNNIILLVDEAHRTQEGSLGLRMRDALPNAHRFGFTGTPIADSDRNTFELFGDENDPGWAISTYDSDRSIADGTTVPMRVVPRPVAFDVDRERLDDAFDALADDEGLEDGQKAQIAKRVANARAVFHNPARIRAVVEDLVSHFYESIDPLGMKAQIVVADQELCVTYADALRTELMAHGYADEAAVVISATSDKLNLDAHKMTAAQEEILLDRFRAYNDPLKFLIVTSKLGTGFNAPIEGVLYLDKPMKLHTLFQTITRTNRPWRHEDLGTVKAYGTIVDYIGMGDGFARAIAPSNPEQVRVQLETATLVEQLAKALAEMRRRFVGVPRESTMDSLQQALERVPQGSEDRSEFRAEFLFAQGLWETIWPDPELENWQNDYSWYAQVYRGIPQAGDEMELIWERLGPKTRELVHQHMTNVRVDRPNLSVVVADAQTIRKMIDSGQLPPLPPEQEGRTPEEIVENLTERIRRKLQGSGSTAEAYRSIAERLEQLRSVQITRAADSIGWLTMLFDVATDLKDAEDAEADGLDPRVGMLARIFEENAPEGQTVLVKQVAAEVDEIVRQVVFDGWASSEAKQKPVKRKLRSVFRNHKIPQTGEPFESAWGYILRHY